jgi:hypothetical protein
MSGRATPTLLELVEEPLDQAVRGIDSINSKGSVEPLML